MRFIENYDAIVKENFDQRAFDDGKDTFTYGQLDYCSAQIYAYLKERGIGREDRIMILLPRSVHTVAAMLGIIKAGAVFIPLEDSYPERRVEYIAKDANCCLVLDAAILEEIYAHSKPLQGHENTDLHDAAYVIYTSGSTGNPKGVLHEYGNIDQLMMTVQNQEKHKVFGLVSPFYFVAGIIMMVRAICCCFEAYIISHDMLRDASALKEFILEKKLQKIFLPPSYVRIYIEPSPYLEEILVAGEPANDLYYAGGQPRITNLYGMSESGFEVFRYVLDKKYDVAPIGRPVLDLPHYLYGDDGQIVEGPGQGELCFLNEYVRGYLNNPTKSKEAWQDGIYHTGDIARRDENGVYYIVGRIDDMVKINGNRVEPGEIEAKVQQVTGLKKVVAKAFEVNDRSFVCVYFIEWEARALGIVKEGRLEVDKDALKKLLPDYMQPAYYISLKEFPLNSNGKIAKKELKCPDFNDYRKEYVGPENEIEAYFCQKMAEVLGLESVSVTDDFFEIGGSSLRAILFVDACRQYPVTSTLLYEYPSPRLLAMHCDEADGKAQTIEDLRENCKNVLIEAAHRRKKEFEEKGEIRLRSNSAFIMGPRVLKDTELSPYEKITLAEEVNEKRLYAAANRAADLCPYVRLEIHANEGSGIYSFKNNTDPIKVFGLSEEVFFGSKENNCHHIVIKYAKNDIYVHINHVLTDGCGIDLYVRALLENYLNEGSKLKAQPLSSEPEYFADVMDDRLPLPKDFCPKDYYTEDFFKIPEGDEKAWSSISDLITVDRTAFEEFCRRKQMTPQIASVLLMAQAILRVHPENNRPIVTRCPMNAREVFGIPAAFQNTSLAHAFFTVNPEDLKAGNEAEAIKELRTAMAEQYSYDNLAYVTNELAFKEGPKNDCQIPAGFMRYMEASQIVTNFMGETIPNKLARHISQMQMEYKECPFPLMLYVTYLGEKACFQFFRDFQSDAYTVAFKEILREAVGFEET